MIVINGEKYTPICEVHTPMSKAQYDLGVFKYGHSICVKNAYLISLQKGTTKSNQACFLVTENMPSTNFIFYDKINKNVMTQELLAARYLWLNSVFVRWQFDLQSISFNAFINADVLSVRPQLNYKSSSGFSAVYCDTVALGLSAFTNDKFTPLFDNVYIGYFPNIGGDYGSYSRLKYDDIGTGIDVLETLNDININNALFLKNCLQNQSINGRIDNTIFAIDWTAYIDGETNPNVEITWESDYLDYEETGNKFDMAFASVKIGESPVKLITFESGVYSTSYKKILKDFSNEWYTKFVEGIGSIFDLPMVTVELIGVVRNGSTDVFSGLCTLFLSPKGTASVTVQEGRKDTITIIRGNGGSGGSGGSDENSPEPSENDTPESPNEPSVNSLSLLTTTYALTPQRLQQFGSFLWDSSFIDNIKLINNSPIENVVSCKLFPLTIGGGSDTDIIVGNVASGVNGQKVTSGTFNFKKNITGFTVSQLFGNFLDFEPFTRISVYLPFIGLKELQPSQIIGKVVSLSYVIDLLTGVCKCIVYANGKQIADYDGAIGIDIPVTSNNRSQVELSYISSALGVVGSIAMSSPLGVVGSVLSGASASYHSQTQGASSPCTSVYNSLTPFMIFDRPKYSVPSAYGKTKGFVCNKTKSIVSCSGFTICHDNIDLSGISCTAEELQEIKQILTSGFFA